MEMLNLYVRCVEGSIDRKNFLSLRNSAVASSSRAFHRTSWRLRRDRCSGDPAALLDRANSTGLVLEVLTVETVKTVKTCSL